MNSQTECLEALASGKTLTNGLTQVHLDSFGAQVHTGYKSSHTGDYTFDSPQYWSIYEPPTQIIHEPSLFWMSVLFLVTLSIAILLYIKHTALLHEHAALQQANALILKNNQALYAELHTYRIDQKKLEDLGASPSQARAIIQASTLYDLDPKH